MIWCVQQKRKGERDRNGQELHENIQKRRIKPLPRKIKKRIYTKGHIYKNKKNKPHTSISCTRYPIRNPIMQYPFIKHEYARYALNYQLIRVINGNTDCYSLSNNLNNSILEKATTHSLYGYKVYAKNMILASYREACNIVDCYTCNNL